MNIIVAGGSGLIGKALTAQLVQNGHQVWVLTRSPHNVRLPSGAQAAAWDGRTSSGWGHLVAEADAVINLAGVNIGALPWTNARKRLIRSSRVEAGAALTGAVQAAARRPRVLLQASAIGYYGPHGSELLTEDAPPGSDFQASVVQDWEDSTSGVEALGVRRVIARSAPVLTTEGGALSRFLYAWRLFLGGNLGSGRQWFSWIHMQDEVSAMLFLLENEAASGVFNLASPEAVTNSEFGRTLAEVMHRPFWAPIPAFALRLLYGEMSTVVLDGQRVAPERLLALGYKFAFPEVRPALENLLIS